MRFNLVDNFLLFLADWLDFNSRFSWSLFLAMPGDPRLHRHRRWIEKCMEDQKKKRKLYAIFQNLKRRELFQEKFFGDSRSYVITAKGKLSILRLKIKQLNRAKFKNKLWLMVLFDVPERLRKKRDIFRTILYEMGFEQLQKSVWVTPYNVVKELKELIKNCNLEKFAKYLFVKKIKK